MSSDFYIARLVLTDGTQKENAVHAGFASTAEGGVSPVRGGPGALAIYYVDSEITKARI
jgi:hypothetical protein